MRLIPDWVYWAAGAVVLAVIVMLGLQVANLKTEVQAQKTLVAQREKTIADIRAEHEIARGNWLDEKATLQRVHAVNSQKANDDFQALRQQDARAAAALRDDNKRLRNQILGHASVTRAEGESDTALAGRAADRLAGYGVLVSEGVELAEEARQLLRQRDAEVKLLKDQVTADRAACSSSL